MIDDFKPVKRPAKSLQETNNLQGTPKRTEIFHTPDEAAARDDIAEPAELPQAPFEAPSATLPPDTTVRGSRKSGWRSKLALHWPPGKKEYLTVLVIIILVGAAVGGFLLTHHKQPAPVIKKARTAARKVPAPVTYSSLTGLPVDPAVTQRPVTGVMIENSLDARPQSGLSEAGVVFEAIAEGGITRFLALYQDNATGNLGPVRSARPYYAQWALGFDAGYAHVGGSPQALANIKAWGVKDLDQFYNSGAYHRISSRAAPHNVYTSIAALNQLEASKGYTSSNYTGFVRNHTAAPSKQPNAKTIDFGLSGPLYNVHYDYNAATNSYNRSEGGAPHIDANSNAQISPKVVIALVIPYGLEADGYHSSYGTIGSGQAFVFQEGVVIPGQWAKTANNSQITFTDANGQPLKLDPGQTWISAVSAPTKVTYSP